MRVADYLEANGLTTVELADRLGLAHSTVDRRLRGERTEMPAKWLRRLETDDPDTPPEPQDGREGEQAPRRPSGSKVEQPPATMDLSTFAGYIEGAYKMGAHVLADSDPALAGAIDSHAVQAGQAWAKWVESEPKVKALLERMMVGTPLGEVIGVHVAIAFSYFLAKAAVMRAQAEQAAANLNLDGNAGDPEPAVA